MSLEMCGHNLPKERCFVCNGGNLASRPAKPARRATKTRTPHAAAGSAAKRYGRVIINTQKGNEHSLPSAFLDIDTSTDCVHIVSYPYSWAIQAVLERAPNLTTIEITEYVRNSVSDETKKLCAARGVAIIVGYENPAVGGEQGNRHRMYRKQRDFMRALDATQKARYDELLAFNLQPALIASRYFRLNGEEEHLTLTKLTAAFGLSTQSFANVSNEINGVLCYLDAPFHHSKKARKVALRLRTKVARLRAQASA